MSEKSEGQGSGCKKKVAQRDSAKQCTKKKNQSPSPSPSNAYQENRKPPWWGSNLIMVKPLSDPSTREPKEPDTPEYVELNETLDDVEDFLEDFQKGVVKRDIRDSANSLLGLNPKREVGGISEDEVKEEARNVARNRSAHKYDVQDDSHLINYLKYRAGQFRLHQQIKQAALNDLTSTPAVAGIPVTTPKSSPIPRRPTKAFDEDTSFFAAVGEYPEDEIDILEESIDEEYREWAMRLKRLEWECEENIKNLDDTETNFETAPSCSRRHRSTER